MFWPVLVAASVVVMVVQLPGPHATAWHFFDLAADLLVGRGPDGDGWGLALYRDHPELQFGPLSIVVAAPFALLGDFAGTTTAEVAVMLTTSALGLLVVRLLFDMLDELVPGGRAALSPFASLGIGLVVVITWGDVAVRTTHIDDALALAGLVAALRFVVRGQASAATAAFAFAAAAKPWAAVFVPLAAVPAGHHRLLRPFIAGGVGVLTWVPFILAEPATLDTSDFAIDNDPTSVLRALGVDAATTPQWVRPAQLVGGFVVVAALVAWHRWPGGLLAGIAWRLLLDPGAHRYYTIGFVLGALLLETRARPGRPPWLTIAGAVLLEATAVPDGPVGVGQAVRLTVVVAALVVAAVAGRRDERSDVG